MNQIDEVIVDNVCIHPIILAILREDLDIRAGTGHVLTCFVMGIPQPAAMTAEPLI